MGAVIEMHMLSPCLRLSFFVFLTCFAHGAAAAQDRGGQMPPPAASGAQEDDETIRVRTELIQTSVSVFDRQGRYVDKLGQEDFELRVDGKLLPLSFFERIEAGGDALKSRAAAAAAAERGGRDLPPRTGRRGRAVVFLVDDLHLSFDSLKRSKDLILRFIDQEVAADDHIIIASPSGKLGFLQQFTDNKPMLRTAVERLRLGRDRSASALQRPSMSEYEALLVDRYAREVTQIFAAALLRARLAINMEDAETQVRSRARGILHYAAINSKSTYAALEQVLRSSAQLPARKLVFFLSDGFFLDTSNTDSSSRLRRITDAATRANAVIYSLDIKGLDPGLPDDANGSFRVKAGERWELQDPLNVVAVSTGGRFIRNTNDLNAGVVGALKETSAYYLLVWRPDPERKGSDQLRRIEVSIKGRPDLSALVQSGYLDAETKPAAEAARDPKTPPRAASAEDQLRAAFNSVVPRRALPTTLVVNYLDTPAEGALSAVAVQIERGAVEFTAAAGGEDVAHVGVVGAIFNSQGKQEAFFRQRLTLTVPTAAGGADDSDIFYNYQAKLRPGLYQVRVAARDEKSGRAGSASQWIEIPDLASRKLTLSSLLLGERAGGGDGGARQQATSTNPSGEGRVDLAINRSFARTSHLRYLVYIYNAARGGNGGRPDVGVLTQVLSGGGSVMTGPVVQVSSEEQDASRLAYAAEIPLGSLTRGLYVLQVTVLDRVTKKSVTQSVEFKLK